MLRWKLQGKLKKYYYFILRIELFPTFRKKKFKSFSWNIFIPCLSTSAKLINLAEEELAPLYIWSRRICGPFSTEASSAIFFLHRGATGRGALTGYIIFPGNTVIVYNHWFLMVVRLIVRVVWPSRCVTTCMTAHRDVRPPRCPSHPIAGAWRAKRPRENHWAWAREKEATFFRKEWNGAKR